MISKAISLWLLGSPWFWGGIVAALVASHGAAYVKGRADVSDRAQIERLKDGIASRDAALKRLRELAGANDEALARANTRAADAR